MEYVNEAPDKALVRPMNNHACVPVDVTDREQKPCDPEVRSELAGSERGTISLSRQGNALELSVQAGLESMGISLLMDWDILIFLYHHDMTLSSADQMARLLCCESTRIDSALDRLECQKLIESSRSSGSARFYRVVVSSDRSRESSFHELLSLTANRTGRLMLARILKPDTAAAVRGMGPVCLS